jgi:hypothetical protein
MAGMRLKGFVGLVASGALLVSSTGAAAATSISAPQQINPWATLTMLAGGAPAAAVCGAAAAAAAAQPTGTGCVLPALDAPVPVASAPLPPPVPPLAAPAAGYGITPLLLGLVAIAAAVGFYLAVKNHGHGQQQPNSPG